VVHWSLSLMIVSRSSSICKDKKIKTKQQRAWIWVAVKRSFIDSRYLLVTHSFGMESDRGTWGRSIVAFWIHEKIQDDMIGIVVRVVRVMLVFSKFIFLFFRVTVKRRGEEQL